MKVGVRLPTRTSYFELKKPLKEGLNESFGIYAQKSL